MKRNMIEYIAALAILATLLIPTAIAGTATAQATSIICRILGSIRTVLFMIAGGIGIVVITLQGIKWAGAADDPGARKQAKEGIIHAIVGMIIVIVAVAIVSVVFTTNYCNISYTGT